MKSILVIFAFLIQHKRTERILFEIFLSIKFTYLFLVLAFPQRDIPLEINKELLRSFHQSRVFFPVVDTFHISLRLNPLGPIAKT